MEYLEELNVKSVDGMTKWFISELKKKNVNVDVECVKTSGQILIYWAIGNKLHKFEILGCAFVRLVKIEACNNALNEIFKTVK